MAFTSRIGNILKRVVSNHIRSDLPASSPSIFQAIRCMSSSKLFIGGLSYSTDEQSLREAFTSYGEVIEARVIMDRETGRSRGFGFVNFTSSEEASAAIAAMDGKDLHGRMVRVNYATDRTGGFRGGYGGGGGGYGGGGYGGGGGGYGDGGGGSYGGGNSYGSGGGGYGSGGTGGYGGDSYGSGGGGGSYGSGGGGYGGNSGGGNYSGASEGGGNDGYIGAASGGGSNDGYMGAADSSSSSYGGSGGMGYGSSQGSMNAGGGYNQGGPIEGNIRDDVDDDEPADYANKRG
ncbi:glycine-rich RNA-binding protein 2, mitochondrial-like [Magnolia sinica]|uniref:glycine-rich RNA-binding protein 2, mitochondrial-like n=1 Tax=Magnolia sinica TaxID=86752 RepID=UPI00265B091B|nr:glycine-rich RNA-binding protein 2, mitochondrial-like [Magnolia sinica]XP_058070425.1 glycine-rich RNA-binding protein 2, mitochondrial-like [Magnolia sinica]